MPNLGNLWYTLGIKDETGGKLDSIISEINNKLNGGSRAITVNNLEVSAATASAFVSSLERQIASAAAVNVTANVNNFTIDSSALASLTEQVTKAFDAAKISLKGLEIGDIKTMLTTAIKDSFEYAKGDIAAKIKTALTTGGQNVPITINGEKIAESIANALSKRTLKLTKVSFDGKSVADEIEKVLKGRKFKIEVIIDKMAVEAAVQKALSQAGLKGLGNFSTSDLRLERANAVALAAADKHAIAQARLAAMHDKASRAAEKHTRYEKAISDQMRTSTQVATILGNAIGNVFSVYAVKSFLTEVVKVGGELEKQRLAMGAIMGDTYQAGEIYKQVANLSMISPFDVEDLVKYSKQLNAFGIKYSELYDTTKRLSDIAAAVGVDFGRIAYEFGQTSARGWLDGRELRMFANSGIPLLQKLSEYYTKARQEIITAAEVREMITKREVSFQDVKAVLWEMTNAGGEFYQMQEVMAESLAAKWRNLGNAWNLMMGDVAESGMGKGLKKLAEVLTTLTENWGTVATVIGLVSARMASATLTQNTYNTALSAGTKEALAMVEAENVRMNMMAASKQRTMLAFVEGLTTGYSRLSKTAFAAAVAEKKLTTAQVEELVLSKNMPAFYYSLSKAERLAYLQTLGLSAAQAKAAVSSSVLSARVGQLTGSIVAMTKAMFVNPATWIFAGISAAVMLYERYNDQVREAEERTEKTAEKAKEGYRNLTEFLNSSSMTTTPTNEAGFDAAFKEMKEQIKNYAPDWGEIFAEAFGDATHKGIDDMVERYDFLKKKLIEIQESYKILNQLKGIFEDANKSTGGWLEIFDETALTNLKQADDELSKVEAKILKASKEIETEDFVKNFAKANANFAKWLNANVGKSNYDKLSEIIKNYRDDVQALRNNHQIEVFPELVGALNAMSRFGTKLNDARDDAADLADEIVRILDALKSDEFDPKSENSKRALRMELQVVFDEEGIRSSIGDEVFSILEDKGYVDPIYNYVETLETQKKKEKKEPKENKTDEQLKAWQERFKKLKEAYQEYKKWYDIYKSDAAAISKTKGNPLFADLDVDPSQIKKNLEVLRDEIKTTTKARRDFQLQVGGEVVNIDYNAIKEAAKKASDAMREQLTEDAKRWDLARKFNEAGVGMDEAIKIAFEADLQVWDRQAREMADRLSAEMFEAGMKLDPNEEFGVSFKMNNVKAEEFFGENGHLYQLWKAVKDHIEKNGIDLYGKSAGSIKTFANIEQQITTLRNRMETELAAADGADPLVLEGIRRNFEEQISKLKQEFFEGSDVYKRLTQDTTNFGVAKLAELRKFAKGIKEAMDAGTTSKDSKGNIVRAFTYDGKDYEVTERSYNNIAKLIEKLEKKAKSATDSFKQMWKWINGKDKLTFKDVAKDIETVLDSLSDTADQLSQLFGGSDTTAGKVAGAIGGTFKGLEQITKAFDMFSSGDYLGGINGTLQGINTAVSAIQDLMPEDKNARLIDAMHNMQKAFETSIDNLSDIMKSQNVEDAYETYLKQQENIQTVMENTQKDIAEMASASRDHFFIGAARNYHSVGYYIDKMLSDADWDTLRDHFGVNGSAELFSMSSDKWYDLITNFPTLWANIQKAIMADEDNPASESLIDDLVEYANMCEKAQEATKEWMEYTTGIAFSEIESAFDNLIKNMSASMQDYEDSFEEMIYNAQVNYEVLNKLKTPTEGREESLYDEYYRKLAEYSDGGYSKEEVIELRKLWDNIVQIAEEAKENAKEVSGWNGGSGSGSSLSSAIQGVSAEQVDLLAAYANGIRGDTAVQRTLMEQLIYVMLPAQSINAASQLAQLNSIAANTATLVLSNQSILDYITSLDNRLRSVIDGTAKVYVK